MVWSPTGTLIEFPKYWWDESFAVEAARTFNEIGKVDITVAPLTPSHIAIVLNSNGFPLSLPLALLYRFTGVSLLATRIMMIVWMLLLFVVLYQFLKRHIGHDFAIRGLLLLACFAPLYGNGRTATGDVPGLLFFVLTLMALSKERYFASGALAGLALVSKTSSYHVAPIAIGLAILYAQGKQGVRPLMRYITGGSLVALFWLWLLLPSFSWSAIAPAMAFFQYPTHKPSIISLAIHNPFVLFNSAFVFVVIAGALLYFGLRKTPPLSKRVTAALTIYALLQTVVYLRSAGWSRYLLSVECLAILLLPLTLARLSQMYVVDHKRNAALVGSLMLIAGVFSIHYQFFSNIFISNSRDGAVATIMETLDATPGSTVGFVNDPITASLIPGDRKYQYLRLGGNTYAGSPDFFINPKTRPTYITYPIDTKLFPTLNNAYTLVKKTPEIQIWKKN